MSVVYYQGPTGRTLSIVRSATIEGSSTTTALTETARAGVYKATVSGAAVGDTVTILSGSAPYDDGIIGEDDNGELRVMRPAKATRTAVEPYSSHSPQRVSGTKLTAFLGESSDVSLTVECYDADGDPLSLTGLTLKYHVAPHDDPDAPIYSSDSFTGSGTSFTLALNSLATAAEAIAGQAHHWSLRQGTKVLQRGRLEVVKTAAPAA